MRKQVNELVLKLRKLLRKKTEAHPGYLTYLIIIFFAFITALAGIIAFTELTEELYDPELLTYETKITDLMVSLRNPGLNELMVFFTQMGDLRGYIIITVLIAAAFYIKFKSWKYIIQLVLVILLAGLANRILKAVFNRPRPEAEHLVTVETLSYPSGHAMSAMAFYGFLIFLFSFFKMKPLVKGVFIGLFVVLIAVIGISRIYLGVHYPSDVLAGYIAGLAWLALCILIFYVIDLFRKRELKNQASEIRNNQNP